MENRGRSERGQALAFTGIGLVAFVAVTVVAVDIGRLAHVANETQTVADAAATAGATAMLVGGSATTDAQTVAGRNNVNGSAFPAGGLTIDLGTWASGSFSAGGAPANAVRATAVTTVSNLLAGFFSDPTTQVTKIAVATFQTTGTGTPNLPLAVGRCNFTDASCMTSGCLPTFSVGNTNTAAFTGFTGHSTPTITSYVPLPCGGGATAPELHAGGTPSTVDTTNGGPTPVWNALRCLLNNNPNATYVVPVVQVNCGSPINGAQPVAGFATIKILSITGNGNNTVMSVKAVLNDTFAGPAGGCAGCGTGYVKLVN